MRHLVPFRVYESKTTSVLTPDQEEFLNRYTQGTWSVNPGTGLVDVTGNFYCHKKGFKSLHGVSFGHVSGQFVCHLGELTTLAGAPLTVGDDFFCQNNQLTSLEGAPQTVGGSFWCDNNQLTSLEGAPQTVDGLFSCGNNQLTSLTGAPQYVGGYFNCSGNQLQSLEGAPEKINGEFKCDEFELESGKWNFEGWVKILKSGSVKAKILILTLPYFDSNFWNSKISKNPESAILQLSEFWDDMPDDLRNSIQIPSDLRDDLDNLLDLVRAGIM